MKVFEILTFQDPDVRLTPSLSLLLKGLIYRSSYNCVPLSRVGGPLKKSLHEGGLAKLEYFGKWGGGPK